MIAPGAKRGWFCTGGSRKRGARCKKVGGAPGKAENEMPGAKMGWFCTGGRRKRGARCKKGVVLHPGVVEIAVIIAILATHYALRNQSLHRRPLEHGAR